MCVKSNNSVVTEFIVGFKNGKWKAFNANMSGALNIIRKSNVVDTSSVLKRFSSI